MGVVKLPTASWWLILEQQCILATAYTLASSSILIHSITNEICVQRIGGRLMQPTPQVGMHLSSVVQWPRISESDTVAQRPAIISFVNRVCTVLHHQNAPGSY